MGTGSFPWVKQLGRGIDHPPPSCTKAKERVELYLYSTFGSSWPVTGWTLPLLELTCGICEVVRTSDGKLQCGET